MWVLAIKTGEPGYDAAMGLVALIIVGVPVALIAVIIAADRWFTRRKRTQRGFEVITKPDSKMGQEARKD